MEKKSQRERMREAIRLTAPGQPLRTALDMIIAGHLGALICVGDTEAVLAAGNDGFPLNISFTSHRLFELSKMDGAIVIDGSLSQILRANFHLNPDPSLATSETGMRHRTAARMSVLTDAIVISVSERRSVINVYVDGKAHQVKSVADIMNTVGQLLSTLQTTRTSLDRQLVRLTALELDDYVTLSDVTEIFSTFELIQQAKEEIKRSSRNWAARASSCACSSSSWPAAAWRDEYNLMIRDYAADSTEENAAAVRERFRAMSAQELTNPKSIASALGYQNLEEDSVLTPLGLRTLSRVSVVRDGVAEKIVDEYDSFQDVLKDIKKDPERLRDFGVNNPTILADSLSRMQSKR